jgi:NADPH-dependent 2,4-dienoyl-CoA reductase/sulfur reductase-like enzyme
VREILIVGANVAGVSTAAALRAEGFGGIIRLVDAERHLPYERPPLSKSALSAVGVAHDGGSAPEAPRGAAPPPLRERSFYDEAQIDLVLGRRVASLSRDLVARLDDGHRIVPDAVVLATGARPRRLTVSGAEDPRVVTLRTWDDAVRIAAALRPGAAVLVVGGGLIGAEVAASAVDRGCRVTWIERGDRCLEGALGRAMAAASVAHHRARGAVVRTSREVGAIERGAALAVRLRGGGERIEVDVIVVGIGVEPEVALAIEAGADVDAGILVDGAGRTRNPRLFAVGDVARVRGTKRGEHWQRAIEQGTNAARALSDKDVAAPEVPWFWSDQFDRHLEVVGEMRGADREVVRGQPLAGDGSVFAVREGRVIGAATCNRPKEARAAMRLIRAVKPVREEQLADEATDLRKLVLGGAA